jgi:hypothetical protein
LPWWLIFGYRPFLPDSPPLHPFLRVCLRMSTGPCWTQVNMFLLLVIIFSFEYVIGKYSNMLNDESIDTCKEAKLIKICRVLNQEK